MSNEITIELEKLDGLADGCTNNTAIKNENIRFKLPPNNWDTVVDWLKKTAVVVKFDALDYSWTLEGDEIKNSKGGKNYSWKINDKLKLAEKIKEILKKKSNIFDTIVSDPEKELDSSFNNYDSPSLPLNIIFCGPPGTGKTWHAKELCGANPKQQQPQTQPQTIAGLGHYKEVCFHPAKTYEDFVRSLEISTIGSNTSYTANNKVFGQICDDALSKPDNLYAIVIDEINRANLPAVLGELMNGLEYRGQAITVPYAVAAPTGTAPARKDDEIIVPSNLLIIGTMNTADRSVGQMDYAIRRRFQFLSFLPDPAKVPNADNGVTPCPNETFMNVLKLFVNLPPTPPPIDWSSRADTLSRDFHPSDVAIGHTYFMGTDWEVKFQYQVLPILVEYLKDGVLLADQLITGNKNNCIKIQEVFFTTRNQPAQNAVDKFNELF